MAWKPRLGHALRRVRVFKEAEKLSRRSRDDGQAGSLSYCSRCEHCLVGIPNTLVISWIERESERMPRLKQIRIASWLNVGLTVGSGVVCMAFSALGGHPSFGPAHDGPAYNSPAYIGYDQARPILDALKQVLPPELQSLPAQNASALWDQWVAARDRQIRSRLERGDEDSLVNFLLFGTSFTTQKRLTIEFLAEVGRKQANAGSSVSPEGADLMATVRARADDLVRGMQAPGQNERLTFVRRLLERKGYTLTDQASRNRARDFLLASFARVLGDQASYAESLENARKTGDASQEFAERSRLYRERGLSSDTSLFPDFAIAETLAAMKSRGLLAPGSVRRVAIVGPGLDFTDKQDGYDFYPLQSVQPFAVMDSLLRLGLSSPQSLGVATFDLSPRINDHLAQAAASARRGIGYTVQLPFDTGRGLKQGLSDYWSGFGGHIGTPVQPAPVPPAFEQTRVRAIRVRPELVTRLTPVDLNIVLQRLQLDPGDKFDLIIATNILVYYDTFEQSLALANVASMLRPSGFLLSNNGLTELPSIPMQSVDYQTVVYSDRPGDGDHIVWYQRTGQ